MKSFLEYVAEDILQKYGTNLAHIAVVFPNKRASLFLNEHLARQAGKPIWSPTYITISDLFRKHSERIVADPIKLICELHKSFVNQTGIDETLDHFYSWGQLLIADFDDIDKNMADASKVFANLRDIHELDDVSYLSEEQKEVIRRFFSNFSDEHNSLLKERFLSLWQHLNDIYQDFNVSLERQGLAYEGALYREVVQQEDIAFDCDMYLFVGFNLIQQVEQRLFEKLQRLGKARFYWDYDNYYMKGNEAGHFISQYLTSFPNELDTSDRNIYASFQKSKNISLISAPTENVQARFTTQWLREDNRMAEGRKTAVVLCNEALLQSVVHCLPDEVEKVNITTGYPLTQTPVAALVAQLIELRTNGYAVNRDRFRLHFVNKLLRHPYINQLTEGVQQLLKELNTKKIYYPSYELLATDDITTKLFQPIDNQDNSKLLLWMTDVIQMVSRETNSDDPLFQESLFRMYTLLNRLVALVNDGDLVVDVITLQRLIVQLVQGTSIPFHGEPAEGLQIMGVLETRNLDFSHLLILSCNEGNMPKGVNDTSFIPYNIRKAYGLTTIDHKVAIYSYYFHRLLQRADDITIVYNNATTDGQRGETSRFLLQLMVESTHKINFKSLQGGQVFIPFSPKSYEKTPEVMSALKKRFSLDENRASLEKKRSLLTPTAINTYMRCPLRFFYQYVYGLREPDTNDEDTIDNRIFGNIFHEASQQIYERMRVKNDTILASELEQLLKTKIDIERVVDDAIRTELFQIRNEKEVFKMELNGLQLINREVIIHYIQQLIKVDEKLAPFTILGLEDDVITTVETYHIKTTLGGRIDRLDMITDEQGEHIRVIDYKTGGNKLKPLADVDAIFQQENLSQHSDYYLQTFLYAMIVKEEHPTKRVSPALLFIQHAGVDNYNPILKFDGNDIDDIADYSARFKELLIEKINEIFNPETTFAPTEDRSRCNNCPFKNLCRL